MQRMSQRYCVILEVAAAQGVAASLPSLSHLILDLVSILLFGDGII